MVCDVTVRAHAPYGARRIGLVGYDVAFTRLRSWVQPPDLVLLLHGVSIMPLATLEVRMSSSLVRIRASQDP